MHYIRLLRQPSFEVTQSSVFLNLILTITTDLGESFLCPEVPIGLVSQLETESSVPTEQNELPEAAKGSVSVKARQERRCIPLATLARAKNGKLEDAWWRAGMRVLKLAIRFPQPVAALLSDAATRQKSVCIRPTDRRLAVVSAGQILAADQGLIVPVWIDMHAVGQAVPFVALRKLWLSNDPVDDEDDGEKALGCVEVEEEICDSIARHVWDAGLVTAAYLASVCLTRANKECQTRSADGGAALANLLRGMLVGQAPSHILELGCGVGIVGLALAALLRSRHSGAAGTSCATPLPTHGKEDKGRASILLTDLPEAEEQAVANIARFYGRASTDEPSVASLVASSVTCSPAALLRYENLDWDDGSRGVLGPKAADGLPWDLLVLSDCTYNVDMLPALVRTLSSLHATSSASSGAVTATGRATKTPSVLLARKHRHSSEEAVFDLLRSDGWALQATATVPLPVLNGQLEAIEIYLYGKSP